MCSYGGCPNEGSWRSIIWKILLNYLPLDRNKWSDLLLKRRNEYKEFVREMIIRPGCNPNNTYSNTHNDQIDHVNIYLFIYLTSLTVSKIAT